MKITFMTGATATKLIGGKPDKKATRFFGGETEDIVEAEAKVLVPEFAAKAGSKEAAAFLKAMPPINPRTRRQRLDAETPGLKERLEKKGKAKARTLSTAAQESVRTAKNARSREALL